MMCQTLKLSYYYRSVSSRPVPQILNLCIYMIRFFKNPHQNARFTNFIEQSKIFIFVISSFIAVPTSMGHYGLS